MNIIFFPFTCVADRVAQALATCFGSFRVYQPVSADLPDQMRAWEQCGIMAIRVPVTGDEKELERVIQSFRIWADLHGGNLNGKAAKFKTRLESMARLSDMSSSQIVAEIKDNVQVAPSRKIPDLVQASRIFLYFAQEFDRQNYELADELARSDREQAELIRQLKTEYDPMAVELANPPMPLSDSTDDYLIADRLESWSRIFLQDTDTYGLLVTHSTAAMEYLLERASTAVQVIKTDVSLSDSNGNSETAVWQEALKTCLKRLFQQKHKDACTTALQQTASTSATNSYELTVYQVPDQSPRELLTNCFSIEPAAADGIDRDERQKNALVGLIRVSYRID